MKTLLSQNNLVFHPPMLGCVLFLSGLPGSGNKIYDRGPYGIHGTITGATWKRLPSGLWCLDFDGIDDYVILGTGANPTTNDFTILAWINANLSHGANFIASNRETSSPYSGFLYYTLATTGVLNLQLNDQSNYHIINIGKTKVADDTWHYVALVVDRGNNKAHSYIDGALDKGNVDISAVSGSIGSINELQLATDEAGGGSDGDILITLFQLCNRTLSALEIQNYFNREKNLFGVW